jgi:hypothetical protein
MPVVFDYNWITDKPIEAGTVKHLAACGRARRKIEREHNNVLKNHGYNLEHNFWHGQNHVSENFYLLPVGVPVSHDIVPEG